MICQDICFFKSNLLFIPHAPVGAVAADIQKLSNLIGYRKFSRNFVLNNLKELLLNLINVHSCCVLVFYYMTCLMIIGSFSCLLSCSTGYQKKFFFVFRGSGCFG